MVYLAELKVCITVHFRIVRICALVRFFGSEFSKKTGIAV